jgi:hypothetical protein
MRLTPKKRSSRAFAVQYLANGFATRASRPGGNLGAVFFARPPRYGCYRHRF